MSNNAYAEKPEHLLHFLCAEETAYSRIFHHDRLLRIVHFGFDQL